MKRRHPLATLVRLASLKERKARSALGSAQVDVIDKAKSVDQRRAELLAMLAEDQPLPAHVAMALRLQGIAGAEMVELARGELDASERRLDHDRRNWQEAAYNLEAKEELEGKRKREHAVIAAKAAERALDEMIAARHRGVTND